MRFVWPGAGPVAVCNNMRAALNDCVVCALRLLLAACATRVFFFSNPRFLSPLTVVTATFYSAAQLKRELGRHMKD